MKTYEIYNLTANELLADNLKFEDLPELFDAYAKFFPEDKIIACCREKQVIRKHAKVVTLNEVNRMEFYSDWFSLIDELVVIGNIY